MEELKELMLRVDGQKHAMPADWPADFRAYFKMLGRMAPKMISELERLRKQLEIATTALQVWGDVVTLQRIEDLDAER
jgi:hypothetical protein